EVVCDDLLVLPHAVAGHPAEPVREARVEVGSGRLGHGLVGRIADEQVPEPVRLLASELGTVRTQQLLAGQREELYRELATFRLRNELGHRSSVEHLALDRTALQDSSLRRGEAVEPGS